MKISNNLGCTEYKECPYITYQLDEVVRQIFLDHFTTVSLINSKSQLEAHQAAVQRNGSLLKHLWTVLSNTNQVIIPT